MTGYYEDKPFIAGNCLRKPPAPKLVDTRVQMRVLEENRTAPRDLGSEREYSWEK